MSEQEARRKASTDSRFGLNGILVAVYRCVDDRERTLGYFVRPGQMTQAELRETMRAEPIAHYRNGAEVVG